MSGRSTNYIFEAALVLWGLAILASPSGKMPRMPIELGLYKYPIGFALILAGLLLFWRTPKA